MDRARINISATVVCVRLAALKLLLSLKKHLKTSSLSAKKRGFHQHGSTIFFPSLLSFFFFSYEHSFLSVLEPYICTLP